MNSRTQGRGGRVAFVAVACVAFGCSHGRAAPVPKGTHLGDAEAIQGAWHVTEISHGGVSRDAKGWTFTFNAGELIVDRGDKKDSSKFRLDETKKPRHFDLVVPEQEEPVPGIYELSGDVLKICLNGHWLKNPGRPRQFGSEARELHHTLIVLQRKN